jgi:hypothetical protein
VTELVDDQGDAAADPTESGCPEQEKRRRSGAIEREKAGEHDHGYERARADDDRHWVPREGKTTARPTGDWDEDGHGLHIGMSSGSLE